MKLSGTISGTTDRNKSQTMSSITLNRVLYIDWDQVNVMDTESNKMDRWIKDVILRS